LAPSVDSGGPLRSAAFAPFVDLVSLDLLIIVDEVLAIPVCLALYLSLRRVHESLVLLATALSVASILCFLIATPALNMLYRSQQYAAAASSVDREGLLAAGQAVLSSCQRLACLSRFSRSWACGLVRDDCPDALAPRWPQRRRRKQMTCCRYGAVLAVLAVHHAQ
jgi:hypothetical protein